MYTILPKRILHQKLNYQIITYPKSEIRNLRHGHCKHTNCIYSIMYYNYKVVPGFQGFNERQ